MNNSEIIRSESATPAEKLAAIIRATTNSKHPDRDTATLLEAFGSVSAILESPAESIAAYVGNATAERLSTLLPIIRLYEAEKAGNPAQIANRRELEAYCKGFLLGNQIEEFWIIAVNAQCRVLGKKRISTGDVAEVSAYPRQVVRAALDLNAHSVFICHNHPGGSCAPSAQDLSTTVQLKRILNEMNIMLLDHVIIAGNSAYSLAQHGDIDFR